MFLEDLAEWFIHWSSGLDNLRDLYDLGKRREPRPLDYIDRLRLRVPQLNDSDAICPIDDRLNVC